MKDRIKNPKKENKENTDKARIKNGLLDIGKQLGIAIPAGLLLLLNINANDTTQNQFLKDDVNIAKELNKLQTNGTVKHLLSTEQILLAQVHTNVGHTNVYNPNVTNNGKHLNVHNNRPHTNYTRY